jgi:hypothetical protein
MCTSILLIIKICTVAIKINKTSFNEYDILMLNFFCAVIFLLICQERENECPSFCVTFNIKTKDYEIGICCFCVKHAASRRKSNDWLARSQDTVSA